MMRKTSPLAVNSPLGNLSAANSPRTQSLAELEKGSINRPQVLSQSPFSTQPPNLTHDARILNSSLSHSHTANAGSLDSKIESCNDKQTESSDLQNRNKNNLHEVQQPLKASSEERVRVVREGEENDFAIQVSSPSLKIKSIKNPCEKDSNQSGNLVSLSLRGEAEAIHKNTDFKDSKILDSHLDCHDSANAETRNDKNTESKSIESQTNNNKTLNKIYNLLFFYNLNERRSPKKCDKFHSLGLQGIVGKWRSPLKMKGDFKGGTLPPLHNTHEVRIGGGAEQNIDSSDFDKNRNKINLHEVQQPQKASPLCLGIKRGIRGATSRLCEAPTHTCKFKPPCPPLYKIIATKLRHELKRVNARQSTQKSCHNRLLRLKNLAITESCNDKQDLDSHNREILYSHNKGQNLDSQNANSIASKLTESSRFQRFGFAMFFLHFFGSLAFGEEIPKCTKDILENTSGKYTKCIITQSELNLEIPQNLNKSIEIIFDKSLENLAPNKEIPFNNTSNVNINSGANITINIDKRDDMGYPIGKDLTFLNKGSSNGNDGKINIQDGELHISSLKNDKGELNIENTNSILEAGIIDSVDSKIDIKGGKTTIGSLIISKKDQDSALTITGGENNISTLYNGWIEYNNDGTIANKIEGGTITISGGSKNTFGGLTNYGTTTINGNSKNTFNAGISNFKDFTISGGETTGTSITNSGTFTITNGTNIFGSKNNKGEFVGSFLNNNKTIITGGTNTINNITNNGTFELSGNLTSNAFSNSGTMTVSSGANSNITNYYNDGKTEIKSGTLGVVNFIHSGGSISGNIATKAGECLKDSNGACIKETFCFKWDWKEVDGKIKYECVDERKVEVGVQGSFTNQADSGLTLSSGTITTADFRNYKELTLDSGSITIKGTQDGGGRFVNKYGSKIVLKQGGAITFDNSAGSSLSFHNDGVIDLEGGILEAKNATSFVNNRWGTMNFNKSGTYQFDSLLNSGTMNIYDGGGFSVKKELNNSNTIRLYGTTIGSGVKQINNHSNFYILGKATIDTKFFNGTCKKLDSNGCAEWEGGDARLWLESDLTAKDLENYGSIIAMQNSTLNATTLTTYKDSNIIASGAELTITKGFTNNGNLIAQGGGKIIVNGEIKNDNKTGTIQAYKNSSIDINGNFSGDIKYEAGNAGNILLQSINTTDSKISLDFSQELLDFNKSYEIFSTTTTMNKNITIQTTQSSIKDGIFKWNQIGDNTHFIIKAELDESKINGNLCNMINDCDYLHNNDTFRFIDDLFGLSKEKVAAYALQDIRVMSNSLYNANAMLSKITALDSNISNQIGQNLSFRLSKVSNPKEESKAPAYGEVANYYYDEYAEANIDFHKEFNIDYANNLWADFIGGFGSVGGEKLSSYGIIGGYDWKIAKKATLGGYLAYSYTNFTFGSHNIAAGIYSRAYFGANEIDATLNFNFGINSYQKEFLEKRNARFYTIGVNPSVNYGYLIQIQDGGFIKPLAGLNIYYNGTPEFTESGGFGAMSVKANNNLALSIDVGAEYRHYFSDKYFFYLMPKFEQFVLDFRDDTNISFVGGQNTLWLTKTSGVRTYFAFLAGGEFAVWKKALMINANIGYKTALAKQKVNNKAMSESYFTASLGLKWQF